MLIKKITATYLVLLLLITQSGMAFSVHFCGGEIASVKPVLIEKQKSCDPKMENSGCCKNVEIKAAKKHDLLVKAFAFPSVFYLQQQSFSLFKTAEIPGRYRPIATYFLQANGPPLYRLYSQYIFYA